MNNNDEYSQTFHSQSPILESWMALESWRRSWTLVHEAVVTCLYISCSLQSLPQPHLDNIQECMKETVKESEEDGEHSLQIMYLIISISTFFFCGRYWRCCHWRCHQTCPTDLPQHSKSSICYCPSGVYCVWDRPRWATEHWPGGGKEDWQLLCQWLWLQAGEGRTLFTPVQQGALHIHPGKCGWTELEWAEHGGYGTSDGSHLLWPHDDELHQVQTHAPAERQKSTTLFHHHGHYICRTTFLFLHNMGESQFKTLKARYLSEGLVPRVRGHTGRIPPNSLVREDVERIISFVTQYYETNAILLPGRVPGYKRDDIQILPSTTTKRAVWRMYKETCTSLEEGCSILHVLQGLEAFSPTRHRCTADDWPLLDLSAEQYCDRSQC